MQGPLCITHLFFLFSVTSQPISRGRFKSAETQYAVCNVLTKEIEVMAKVTVARQLRGVCSPREFNKRFNILLENLEQIKQALGIHAQHSNQGNRTSEDYIDYNIDKKDIDNNFSSPLTKNDELEQEISTFNDTVVESTEGDLYFYYWRIPKMSYLLSKKDIYISSPAFSVLGHTLHLQLYPNYMGGQLGISLKPESSSFLKKHKIIFLSYTKQISSRLLYGIKNEVKMFKIEPQLLDDEFLANDSLLVKLKIYLVL